MRYDRNEDGSETVRIDVPGGRFLSAEGCRTLFETLKPLCTGGGGLQILVRSRQVGYLRWARNDIVAAGDTVTHELYISRLSHNVGGTSVVDRLDTAALQQAVAHAENTMHARKPSLGHLAFLSHQTYQTPSLWSDATFAVDAAARAMAQEQLVTPVLTAGLLSAGFLQVTAFGHGVINSAGLFAYVPETRAECSVTVRNAKGTASGWAGKSHRDWAVLNPTQLVATALDKCQRSKDAVAIEPGRYTVVLEPQAVANFLAPMIQGLDSRDAVEGSAIPRQWFWRTQAAVRTIGAEGVDSLGFLPPGKTTLIGQRIVDPRVTISADPVDPEMPFVPFANDGSVTNPQHWIEQGVLQELQTSRYHARVHLHRSGSINNSYAFRMAGGPTAVEEMIASTERGLLVTRLVNVQPEQWTGQGLLTGTTSDGLWLIDKGKIKEPVQNFRFRESPIFALNNLESVGPVARVFLDPPAIVPALKIKDFSMTSLANAV